MNVTCVFCVCLFISSASWCMFVYHLFLPVFMYVYILSYFVNKLEIWWLYLSPIEENNPSKNRHCRLLFWYGIREIHGTRNKRLRL